jgi:hypothetical protein
VDSLGLIYFVEHGGERGRLAATRGAGHENDAGSFLNDLAKDRRQSKLLQCRDLRLQPAHHDRVSAVLLENVDAKSGQILQRIATIARAAIRKILPEPLVAIDNVIGQLIDFLRPENGCRRFEWEFAQRAVRLDERGLAHGKEQIGNALAAGDHRGKELIDNLFVHERQPAPLKCKQVVKQLRACRRQAALRTTFV